MKVALLGLVIFALLFSQFAIVLHTTWVYEVGNPGIGIVLYQGTIVRVLDRQGDWCLVAWDTHEANVLCDNLGVLR